MRKVLVIISFLFTGLLSFSQTKQDYEIYQLIIQNQLDKWKQDITPRIVVTDKLVDVDRQLFDDIAANMQQALALATQSNENSKYLNHLICCDTTFQHAIRVFTQQIYEPINIITNNLGFSPPVTIAKSQDIHKMFRKGNTDKVWKKFYKKYPDSLGFFQLSKVSYFDKFALVYIATSSNPLSEKGEIVILESDKNKWMITGHLVLWLN